MRTVCLFFFVVTLLYDDNDCNDVIAVVIVFMFVLSLTFTPCRPDLIAGTDLLSYTVATQAEYQSRVPWLRYKPDHRFDHLLSHPDLLQHTSLDRLSEEDNGGATIEKIITDYPTYFSFQDLVADWAIADTSTEGW